MSTQPEPALHDTSVCRNLITLASFLDATSTHPCCPWHISWMRRVTCGTQQHVVIPNKSKGDKVNLEVDVLGKYVERSLSSVLDRLGTLEDWKRVRDAPHATPPHPTPARTISMHRGRHILTFISIQLSHHRWLFTWNRYCTVRKETQGRCCVACMPEASLFRGRSNHRLC